MRLFSLKKFISPFWRWALFLVSLPILELFLMLHFIDQTLTLLSMFVSGVIGILIAYRTGSRCWAELNRQLDCGESPMLSIFHGVLILLATSFMVSPGLLTRLIGLVLLCRIPRSFIVAYLVLHFEIHRLQTHRQDAPHSPEVIDIDSAKTQP